MLYQDVLDARFADIVAQINNLVPDLLIAPKRILVFESNDEVHNLLCDWGATSIRSVLRSIVFFSNEFLMPPNYSVCREQFCAPLQHLSTEPFGLGGYPHSLAVGQYNAFVLLFLMLHKDSHLFA